MTGIVEEHGPLSVVVVDDDPATIESIQDILESGELTVSGATDWQSGLHQIRISRPQVVILDLCLPGVEGMEMLQRILEIDAEIDVILLTGHYSTDSAVEAIRLGACDYLTKPVTPKRLQERVMGCIATARGRFQSLKANAEESCFEGIVGQSPLMIELFSIMTRIAPHYKTVLIQGQSGTGKELIAKALHRLSPVAAGPFVAVNCAAIAESVFEAELFGHVRGAFTGASHDRVGLVEHAQGGTLFLDEIGEMPLAMQAKLLRLVQNREIQRIGSPVARQVSVRIIAATHQNLATMAADRRFREDLYYRLTSIQLRVPSLCERREDLPLLIHSFLKKYSAEYGKPGLKISRLAEAKLAAHRWPGNVREVENAIAHACLMADADTIETKHLPESVRCSNPETSTPNLISLRAVQDQHIRAVLNHTGGNMMQAAKILGISRATLYRIAPSRVIPA